MRAILFIALAVLLASAAADRFKTAYLLTVSLDFSTGTFYKGSDGPSGDWPALSSTLALSSLTPVNSTLKNYLFD